MNSKVKFDPNIVDSEKSDISMHSEVFNYLFRDILRSTVLQTNSSLLVKALQILITTKKHFKRGVTRCQG